MSDETNTERDEILYKGPFWIFIGPSGMPSAVQKCMFKPTIHPTKGDWHEVHIGLEAELTSAQAEIERLKAVLEAEGIQIR